MVPLICQESTGFIIEVGFSLKAPVVVNHLSALLEVVKYNGGGFIYEDRSELASAIERLAGDPKLRRELGQKGYEAYLEYGTADAHLKTYFELIDSLMA